MPIYPYTPKNSIHLNNIALQGLIESCFDLDERALIRIFHLIYIESTILVFLNIVSVRRYEAIGEKDF